MCVPWCRGALLSSITFPPSSISVHRMSDPTRTLLRAPTLVEMQTPRLPHAAPAYARTYISSAKNLSRATEILQRLTGMPPSAGASFPSASTGIPAAPAAAGDDSSLAATPEACKRAYLRSSVRVLRRNTPQLSVAVASAAAAAAPLAPQSVTGGGGGGGHEGGDGGRGGGGGRWRSNLPPAQLADVSVRRLLKELSDIVDPPRKLPRFKVHLRRAPTQEVRQAPR